MDTSPLQKQCTNCLELKPANSFWSDRSKPTGLCSQCKGCYKRSKSIKRFTIKSVAIAGRKRRISDRLSAITHYSNGSNACACCGERTLEFLVIDHVNGGGNRHRAEIGKGGSAIGLWLRRNNYPEGFQVLCHNCNQAKGSYGKCPHEQGTVLFAPLPRPEIIEWLH